MPPKPDVSAERTNQILAAATNVFAKHGFHSARMDDIVTESGLSKGALYWYFKSKDAILETIITRFFDREMGAIKSLVGEEGTVTDRLYRMNAQVDQDLKYLLNMMPLTLEVYALAIHRKSIRTIITNYLHTVLGYLEEMIRQGMDTGEFRQVDPSDVALTLGAFYEGLILFIMLDPDLSDWKRMANAGLAIVIEGIKTSTER